MNSRERFNAFIHGRAVDHIPDFEFWYWDATLERWAEEGLPDYLVPSRRGGDFKNDYDFRGDLAEYFGFEYMRGVEVKLRFDHAPAVEIITEDEDTQTVRNELGEEYICFKPGKGESIPSHLSYPITTYEDWIRVRDGFLPISPETRLPENWNELLKEYTDPNRDYILNTPGMSFYGFLRNLLGVEHMSITIALEPAWVQEMMEYLLEMYLAMGQRLVADGVLLDCSGWWEDMCYSSGPLISPQMFGDYMVPRYQKVTDFWRAHGVDRAILDSDGNIHKLAPLWLEGGINILLPVEAAHTDIVRLREENPRDLYLRGGFNKVIMKHGREAIDAEFERLKPVLDTGTLMPHADHLIPPDVSLSDYLYYREKKQKLIGK